MKKVTGFTLIELLVTISVAAIMVGLALPSFTDLIQKNQLMTQSNRLITDLMGARAEAVKRNQRAVVCRSADAATCATSGGWEQGWIVFIDADADGDFDSSVASEVQVRAVQALPAGFTLRANNNFTNRVAYLPDGSITLATGGRFTLCDRDGVDTDSREIIISATGRPRTTIGAGTCP